MIHTILTAVTTSLDQYLKQHFTVAESNVVLNNVVGYDGTFPEGNLNKILLSFLNLEENSAVQRRGDDKLIEVSFLLSTNFEDYNESLKMFDSSVLFFQNNPVISIPDQINTLQIIRKLLTIDEMQSLWRGFGAAYRPSLIYVIRTAIKT